MKRDYWQGSPFSLEEEMMYGGLKALPMWQIIFGMKTLGQLRTVSYQKIQMHIFHVQVLDGMQKLSMSKRLFTKCSLHPAKKFATWLLIASKSFEQNWCAESSSLCIRRESVDRNETS